MSCDLDITAIIPHRPPFLLVDRLLELEPGVRAVGLKNVTVNEPFFQGHFPGNPIMPGVLIVEALAQVGAAAILSKDEYKGSIALFAGINRFRFKRLVKPGDSLTLAVELTRFKAAFGIGQGEVRAGETIVAGGELLFTLAPLSAAAGDDGV